jgi:hypothetical protein
MKKESANLSYFEKAGYDKESAMRLEEFCIEHNIPFIKMLALIQGKKGK